MVLPTVIVPGFLEGAIAYRSLEQSLQQLGFPTVTVPLRKQDWLPTLGGRSMVPILRKIDQTVKQVLQQYARPEDLTFAIAPREDATPKGSFPSNPTKINLIGHSAGGWISRIYLGEKPYTIHGDVAESAGLWHAHPYVNTLITLGTPHVSLERWTKRNLDFVNHNYPGAFYQNVRYICVAGKSIYGARRRGSWLAYSSYQLTCGRGDCWGDGITPIEAAHLTGAENLVIEGVRHSPKAGGDWYGSPQALKVWAHYLA